jgi:hypothetical protein
MHWLSETSVIQTKYFRLSALWMAELRRPPARVKEHSKKRHIMIKSKDERG